MTNNDDLALKLKAAAEKALDNFDPNMFILTRDMVALLAEHDADKKRIADQQEHINSLEEGVNMLLAQYDQLAAAIGWTTEKALSGEGNQEQYAEAIVKRIAELEAVCAESYQVVGALADAAGVFEKSDAVSKALDNLSRSRLVHSDVLPFSVEARTVSVKLPRYDIDMSGCDSCGQDCGADMSEEPDGDYVLLSEVIEKLAAAGIKLEVGE